jgi:hypothetical protein
MKKFYLHNGTEQQGPFDLEELRTKSVNKDTPIWYDGLTEWTTADKVDELKELIQSTTPPPFGNNQTPPPINKQPSQTDAEEATSHRAPARKKSNSGRTALIGLLIIVGIVGAYALYENQESGAGHLTIPAETYQEKVMTVEEIEQSQPTNFLSADGNYNRNFWGTKIKVHGVITNKATVASYKDAVVRVTYYSKTKTELSSKDYTIYETFRPHSTTNFELKIENYKDVHSIGWDVIEATAN